MWEYSVGEGGKEVTLCLFFPLSERSEDQSFLRNSDRRRGRGAESPIVLVKWYDTTRWLQERIESFPKSQRFIFGQRLADHSIAVLELLVEAAYSSEKRELLHRANRQIEVLRWLVRQIAALVQKPVRRVSLNGETSVADFVGHWTVNENKQTVFVKGILPQAMREGFILQLDEVDAMQPEIGFVIQQVLEPDGHLLLTDTGEDVAPHPDFRLVATANTLGFGSDSGLYSSGTHTLNFSWLDRWDVIVYFDFLPQKQEVDLLKSRHASLGRNLLKRLVKAATDLRKSHAAEELTTVITTRRLLALCTRLERGNDLPRALAVCVLNKVPQEDATVVRETFDHHLGALAKGDQKNAK